MFGKCMNIDNEVYIYCGNEEEFYDSIWYNCWQIVSNFYRDLNIFYYSWV